MVLDNKKGDLLGNTIIVILTLIVFFALFPAVQAIIDAALGSVTGVSDTVVFMISSVGVVMIIGLLKWIYNTTAGGGE